MSDSPKIHMDDVLVGVRPEEMDSILGLRNTFDYFEVLGNYVSSYLELGWIVKLVMPHLDIVLDLDFRQVREVWNQGLTELAVKGIHTSLIVYTGSASNLLVMEVQGRKAEKALVFGRDWGAQCVMQAGEEKERHFFTWPQALTLPNQTAFETLDVQVFGEGGKVALPPSPGPDSGEQIRWLVPPWENPPSPATPRLLDFLKGHFPAVDLRNQQTEPNIPAWEEIWAHVASHARLMQTLLTPATKGEDYYRTLLQEARTAGLQDQRLLLGLLWHAPLGEARHEPNRLQWLKDFLKDKDSDEIPDPSQIQKQFADLLKELSRTVADLNKERENSLKDRFKTPLASPPGPDNYSLENKSCLPRKFCPTPEHGQEVRPHMSSLPGAPTDKSSRLFIQSSMYPQGDIPVDRKQYEAMIYELGRLEALQKFNNRSVREGNSLKAKIEAQRQEEIDHLRQLVRGKKNKKWW
jgi:hypothetical protein